MDEKYKRIRVLGKGSFGKAYLVRNTEADEECVVKQMETSMMDPKERNEAVKEAMLLKRMNHPNIVRFQEVFMTRKGRLCIVMDYCDGGDVHMEIKRREGQLIPEARILEWFVQVCFAMKHVHENKVLHRDLKTQNIFLMATGQIKLGDFGIARVLDATKDYARTMVGTPYYLSPEIIEDKPYNFMSDVWSCGVVLYEMTTLKHPFDADSLVILASKILKDQAPAPDPMYSAELVALIRSMLGKDAGQRPNFRRILCNSFLQDSMHGANVKYRLGLDLAEFSEAPAVPAAPPAPAAPAPAAPAPAAAEVASQSPAAAVQPQDLPGDPPQPAAAEVEEEVAEEETAAEAGGRGAEEGGESEYEEEFEDYSGSEDGGPPPSELKQSVAKLRLGPQAAAASPQRDLTSLAEEDGCAEAAEPESQAASAAEPGNACRISAKADSLREYLRSQVAEADFDAAYRLVRSSGEASTEELQRQVGLAIGGEKVGELFTLFQLLCFLEDVSSNAEQAAQLEG